MTISAPAFAADAPGVSIPVKISLSGSLPKTNEDYTVVLKADDTAYPMPDGTKEGEYRMTITVAGTKNFPEITYSGLGIYTYTIYQQSGSNTNCSYDKTIYKLTVYITNAENEDGFTASAVLYPESEDDKISCAEFKNVYTATKPTKPKTTKTGDNSDFRLYGLLSAASLGLILMFVLQQKKRPKA